MKSNQLFLMAFAIAGMLVSCNKADDNSTGFDDNVLKTVTLTIANQGGATKAISDPSEEDAYADPDDLQILFLDGSGALVYEAEAALSFALKDVADADVNGTSYTFHNLPAAVKSAVITNESNYDEDLTVAKMKENAGDYVALNAAGAEMLVWGEGAFGEAVGEHNHAGEVTKLYSCSITVAPLVAKVEIGTIAYNKNVLDENDEPAALRKFADFRFEKIGLDLGIAGYTYPGDAAGLAAWQSAKGWNVDSLLLDVIQDEVVTGVVPVDLSGKVCSYILGKGMPAPGIILQGSGTPVAGFTLANPYYIRSNGFEGFDEDDTLQAGKIYLVDFTFTEEYVKPWMTSPQICVDIKVTIKNWDIINVKPNFQ